MDPPRAPTSEAKAMAETPAPASPMADAGYIRAATAQKTYPSSDSRPFVAVRYTEFMTSGSLERP